MPLRDIIRLFCLAAIWGASFLFLRIAAPAVGAIPTAFSRVALSSVGLTVILVVLGTRFDFKNKIRAVLGLGVINSGIPFVMYAIAAKALPANYSAILNATTPMMGVIIGASFFGEQIDRIKVAGVIAGFLGVAILTGAGPVPLTTTSALGALACLVATACYGLAGFLTREWITRRGGLDSKLVTLGSQIGALIAMLPLYAYHVATHASFDAYKFSLPVVLALVALGLACTAFAYILYFQLIANVGPVKSMSVTFLIPLFGSLWGTLFLNEHLGMAHIAGGLMIGVAVWLVVRPNVAVQPFAQKPQPTPTGTEA